MNITTRLVIVIKWFGLVVGGISYIYAFFMFKEAGFFQTAIMMDYFFLVWFAPTWAIGWIFKGYKSIMPYPYPMKKDGEDYFVLSLKNLMYVLGYPFVMALFATILQKIID